MISLAQTLGFVIGPAIQTVVVPLGNEGILLFGKLHLNMYTACGWINVLFSIVNFILFLPFVFKERKIAAREAMLKKGLNTEKETWKNVKQDYLSAWTLIIAFFILVLNFMLLETLGTVLTMDQFAWTKSEALYHMGLLMSVGAVIACVTFLLINPLCKRFPEVQVMIWSGFFLMVIGRIVYIPWSSAPLQIYNETERLETFRVMHECEKNNVNIVLLGDILKSKNVNLTDNAGVVDYNNSIINGEINRIFKSNPFDVNLVAVNCSSTENLDDRWLGCPSSQKWCYYTRAMTFGQFVFGYVLTVLGYPIGVTLIQTIFSKILGPRPQGLWMGLLTGSGCFSRVLGPIIVTYIYTEWGTNLTFGLTAIMMVVSMIWLLIVSKRLTSRLKFEETGTELIELNGQEETIRLNDNGSNNQKD